MITRSLRQELEEICWNKINWFSVQYTTAYNRGGTGYEAKMKRMGDLQFKWRKRKDRLLLGPHRERLENAMIQWL